MNHRDPKSANFYVEVTTFREKNHWITRLCLRNRHQKGDRRERFSPQPTGTDSEVGSPIKDIKTNRYALATIDQVAEAARELGAWADAKGMDVAPGIHFATGFHMPVSLEAQENEIKAKWKRGMPMDAIADEYGVKTQLLRDWLKQKTWWQPRRSMKTKKLEAHEDEIRRKLQAGIPCSEIATRWGISREWLYIWLRSKPWWNDEMQGRPRRSKLDTYEKDIRKKWESGVSCDEIAGQYNVSRQGLYMWVKKKSWWVPRKRRFARVD